MPIITLMTDFGLKDGNVGVMKGVIWSIAPHAHIADLSHLIPPQDIAEAALILARALPYFPPGTVHVCVVDPGVGTQRRPVAVELGEQRVVGPDNGLITMALEVAEAQRLPVQAVHLNQPTYWLPTVSHVFHGRDIFAPVAAHLSNGAPLSQVGAPVNDLVRLELPRPQHTAGGWQCQVIHVDHFGNLSTNLRREHLGNPAGLRLRIGSAEINDFVRTFGERPPGALVALFGSTGNLIISEVNGSAARRLDVRVGAPVEVDHIV